MSPEELQPQHKGCAGSTPACRTTPKSLCPCLCDTSQAEEEYLSAEVVWGGGGERSHDNFWDAVK